MTVVQQALSVMEQAKREIFELRRLLKLTEPYLCEKPADVDTQIRKKLEEF